MSLTRGAPALAGIVGAVLFALLRPSLTDTYSDGLAGQLEWGALGGVLLGLGTYMFTRDYPDGDPTYSLSRSQLTTLLSFSALGAFALLIWWSLGVDSSFRWIFALIFLACVVVSFATAVITAWNLAVRSRGVRPALIKLFVLALVALTVVPSLLFPEEVDRLASTVFSVVVAVSLIATLWIVSNLLVEYARENWAGFSAITAAAVAAVAFAILRGNLSLKALQVDEDPALFGAGSGFLGHVEWPIFGAFVWGLGVFALRKIPMFAPRILVGASLGVVTGWMIGAKSLPWQRPNIPWSTAVVFAAVFAIVGAAWRLRRDGKPPRPLEYRNHQLWKPFTLALAAVSVLFAILAFTSVVSVATWMLALFIAGALYLAVPVFAVERAFLGRVRTSLSQPDAFGRAMPGAITGALVGFAFAAWLRSDFIGTEMDVKLAAMIPLALLGVRIAWNNQPSPSALSAFENRSHAIIFLGPALLFLSSALVIPAVRTIILSTLDRDFDSRNFTGNSFDGFEAEGDAFVGFDNYRELLNDVDTFDFSNWSNIWGSDLFYISLILLGIGIFAGLISGTRQNGTTSYIGTGSSVGSLALGGLLLAFSVLTVLRGTFFNNLWWVITVTSLSVTFGLTIAVLSERAGRLESIAKSLIFMPMAISFVGASIVWRLQYQPRDVTKTQTGVLNALWVKLGELSHAGWPRTLALALMLALAVLIFYKGARRARRGESFGAHVGLLIVVAHLMGELSRRSLGGFRFDVNGEVVPDTILFLQQARPFNNVFLMVILIWIQTGFAMVILSAAIRAVPTELIEAAEVDGASDSQSFFQVVLPQILPTIGVVTTTLIVLVSKVFDIVKVGTGGNFGTNVLANDMFEVSFSFGNFTLGSAIAVFILISVLPVMYLNVRRMQEARA